MSESIEMYLITIARLAEDGMEGLIPLPKLADKLSHTLVSVNQMVKKLEESGLVNYFPYKGVELTERGSRVASRVLRHRRLWEVFLVEHLHLSLAEADSMACSMEHISTDEVIERLNEYLGKPNVNPQGNPIPQADGHIEKILTQFLNQLDIGQSAEVFRIEIEGTPKAFLESEGIILGAIVTPLAIGNEGTMLIEVDHCQVTLSGVLAQRVLVSISPISNKFK